MDKLTPTSNNAYVYIHRRLDTNEVFYVGIGSTLKFRRAYRFISGRRNSIWNRIYKKHGVVVEIMHKNLSWEEACKIEIELIAKYGTLFDSTGVLANMTKGGDGAYGRVRKQESIEKHRSKMLGRVCSEETKRKIGLANKGRPMSLHQKEMLRALNTGSKKPNNKPSPLCIENSIKARIGKRQSPEVIAKRMLKCSGKLHHSAILMCNLETGIFYDTFREAAIAHNINEGTLFSRIYKNKNIKGSIIKC